MTAPVFVDGTTPLNAATFNALGAEVNTKAAATSGLLAARPAAASGGFYYATDQDVLFFSNGTTWTRVGLPAGATTFMFGAVTVAPTGWVRYDGTNLAASTGIYADLYAHLGSTLVTPDTRGRHPVDKGTHVDVDTVGKNEGVPTVGNRRQAHRTSSTLGISNTLGIVLTAGGYIVRQTAGGGTMSVNASGGTVANDATVFGNPTYGLSGGVALTGAVGTNNANDPLDAGAYYVGLLIAKL